MVKETGGASDLEARGAGGVVATITRALSILVIEIRFLALMLMMAATVAVLVWLAYVASRLGEPAGIAVILIGALLAIPWWAMCADWLLPPGDLE